jgi:hypothetical protein
MVNTLSISILLKFARTVTPLLLKRTRSRFDLSYGLDLAGPSGEITPGQRFAAAQSWKPSFYFQVSPRFDVAGGTPEPKKWVQRGIAGSGPEKSRIFVEASSEAELRVIFLDDLVAAHSALVQDFLVAATFATALAALIDFLVRLADTLMRRGGGGTA